MDNVLDQPWTTESFLAGEDRQEGKYEFDGRDIVPMIGGSYAHQRIVANLWLALTSLLVDRPLITVHEMRLRGARVSAIATSWSAPVPSSKQSAR